MELNRNVGNIYTGSLYLSLISLLLNKEGKDLFNKRVLMYSYGSGCATSLFSFKFNDNNFSSVINKEDINYLLNKRKKFSM